MTSQLTRTCQLVQKDKKSLHLSLTTHRLHSIVHLFLIKWGCQPNATRQLLPTCLRVPVCPLDGLLPHSDLHPSLPHRRHILGQLLVITTALAPKSPRNSEQQQNLCPATWKIKATFNELEKITFSVQVQTLTSCKVKWPNVHILDHNSGAVLKRKGSSTPLARLNRGATPARVMLGVTTVLTMTTLISSTNASLPKISYVKSIDAYLAFCFFMVFASLIGEWALGAAWSLLQKK